MVLQTTRVFRAQCFCKQRVYRAQCFCKQHVCVELAGSAHNTCICNLWYQTKSDWKSLRINKYNKHTMINMFHKDINYVVMLNSFIAYCFFLIMWADLSSQSPVFISYERVGPRAIWTLWWRKEF